MTVDPREAPASLERDGRTYYFCSPRCRDRFAGGAHEDPAKGSGAVDPVCGMAVDSPDGPRAEHNGVTYYFCGAGCRDRFVRERSRAGAPPPEDQ